MLICNYNRETTQQKMSVSSLCPEIYSPNLLCWVESAMCPDSATEGRGVIKTESKC